MKPIEPRPSDVGNEANAPPPSNAKIGIRGAARGGGRGGFARGRGRGGPISNGPREEKVADAAAPAPEAKTESAAVASS